MSPTKLEQGRLRRIALDHHIHRKNAGSIPGCPTTSRPRQTKSLFDAATLAIIELTDEKCASIRRAMLAVNAVVTKSFVPPSLLYISLYMCRCSLSCVRKLRDNFKSRFVFQQTKRGWSWNNQLKCTYLNELNVRKPMAVSFSQMSGVETSQHGLVFHNLKPQLESGIFNASPYCWMNDSIFGSDDRGHLQEVVKTYLNRNQDRKYSLIYYG
jgi:hypothetical protein